MKKRSIKNIFCSQNFFSVISTPSTSLRAGSGGDAYSGYSLLLITLLLLLCLTLALPVAADTIVFNNGMQLIVGKTWQENGQVKCDMYGEVAAYPLKDVLRVEKNTSPPSPGTEAVPAQHLAPAEVRRELDVQTLHNEAVALADKGRLREALDKERQAAKLSPDNQAIRSTLGAIYNGLGVEQKKQGDFDAALQLFRNALDYAPNDGQIKKNMAVVYIDMAQQAIGKNDFRQGQELLDSARKYDPQNPYLYVFSGRIAYLGNEYAKAEEAWSRALELAPGLRDVREQLARLRREKTLEEGFETRERDNFSIKFESVHNRDLADNLMQVLRDAYREVGRDFDLYPESAVPVIVYPQADLGQLEYFPDWASGTYDGKIRFGENLWKQNLHMKAVLYHEYTHVLVRMAAGSNVPFWLNEGLAEYEARKFKKPAMIASRERLLHSAMQLYDFKDLARLNIPALSQLPPQAIELAYAQSEAFVTWLLDKYSFRDIRSLLARLGRGDSFQAAVRSEFNEELSVLEQKWRESR